MLSGAAMTKSPLKYSNLAFRPGDVSMPCQQSAVAGGAVKAPESPELSSNATLERLFERFYREIEGKLPGNDELRFSTAAG